MKRKTRTRKAHRSGGPSRATMNAPSLNIKVVGIGGGGGNAVSRISHDFVRGVEFIAINTDHQDLDYCDVRKKVYIGKNLTKGLGTGMNPDLGRQAAEENRSEIAEVLRGADLVFVAAGFGGGTGSGATPIIAEVAKQSGALTLAFVTKPFAFEGSQRQRIAEEAIMKVRDKVDALVVVPNDRIFTIISKDTPILKAFAAIDDVLRHALMGIVEIIVTPGIINVDFADVRAIIQDSGSAIVGIGLASGPERAVAAVNEALNSPLLEVNPEGAQGVLFGVSGGRDMRMQEVNEAAKIIGQTVDPGARIIFGAYHDRRLKQNQIKVTLIATGFNTNANASPLFPAIDGRARGFFGSSGGATMPYGAREEQKGQGKLNEPARAEEELLFVKKNRPADEQDEKEQQKQSAKTDSDAWDIPTFLRRKKK